MRRVLCALLCLVLHAAPTWAATVTYTQSGTQDTWHSGGSTLTNNSLVLSAAVTLTNPGHLFAWCTLSVPMSAAPVAGSAVSVWFFVSTDGGTTYPDSASTPAAAPNMIFPLLATTGTQVIEAYIDKMPVGAFKILIKNDGTGATMNTTWTVKCKTHTLQVQ